MISLNLNRRHKAVLFLVLVAAGISLVAEASAKQTTGVVLLGLAAAWLLGSLRLRVLWLLSSLIACAAGIFTAGQPVIDDWKSFTSSVQDYDRSIFDLRDAVARSIQQDWFTAHGLGIVPIHVQTKGKKKTEEVDPQDWMEVDMMEIPGTTQRWVRPDLGARTRLSFPADVDREELISAIQNQVLQPRPKFSIGDSLIAHRFYSLIGLAFLMAGLFSLGWYVRSVLRAKRAHSQQMA